MGRQEGDGDCCRFLEADVTRLRYHQSGICCGKPAETGWGDGNDFIAYLVPLHACSQPGNFASALGSERDGVPWIDTHSVQYVPVVEPCRVDLNLDLAGAGFPARGGLQPQCIQLTWLCNLERERRACRDAQPAIRVARTGDRRAGRMWCDTHEPGDIAHGAAKSDLALVVPVA